MKDCNCVGRREALKEGKEEITLPDAFLVMIKTYYICIMYAIAGRKG